MQECIRQVWKKAGVTIEESVVKLRLMGNPEKTERLIFDWFSISVSYVMNRFRFVFSIKLNSRTQQRLQPMQLGEGLYTPSRDAVNSIISLAR